MKDKLQKLMLEKKIARLKKELERIENKIMEASEQPIEDPDDTLIVRSHSTKKEKLLRQLEKCEEQLEEAEGK